MRKRYWVVGLLFISFHSAIGQFENFKVTAKKTASIPVIDGVLNEEAWEKAPFICDFIQFEPKKGEPESVKTVLKIVYDDTYIYFGYSCLDPDPEKLVLGTRRDGLQMGVDSVDVALDTFDDKRSGYYFRTNPLGVQHDGRISDNGRVADTNWDGTWKSAGAILKEGWSAEMAIPFATMKFKPGKNQRWGLQAARYFPRNFEKSFWTGPLEDYRPMSVCGSILGLDLVDSSKNLAVIPHVRSRVQERTPSRLDGGLDASYDFSQFASGYLTVNPDFATVEADQEQVNLTRFELNLPEKRNFFLEDDDIYQQKFRLFYSRRIADIYGGAKFYGKSGPYAISALSVQTKESGYEGDSANFSVFRMKRDIFESSSIGFLAVNRLEEGKARGAFGLDIFNYISDTLRFQGQLAASYGANGKNDLALFLGPSYDTNTLHLHLSYSYLGLYFGENANAAGFIREDNRHELDSAFNKTFWLKKWGLNRIKYSSSYNIYWGIDRVMRSWAFSQGISADWQNKLSLGVKHEQDYKLYEKEFWNAATTVEVGYNTREWRSASLSYEFGKNFDSEYNLLSANLRQYVTQDLSCEYRLSKLYLSPDPQRKTTWIHVLVANQYFTKDLYLKLFYQINSAIEKQNIQVVFAYRFQPPFGLIQLAYQKGTGRFGEAGTQGHTLFVKLAYVF